MALVLNDKSKRVSKLLRRRPPIAATGNNGASGGDSRKNHTFTNHSVQYVKRLTSKTPSPKIKLERNESSDSNADSSTMKTDEPTKDKTNSKKVLPATTEDIVDSPNIKCEPNASSDADGDEKMDCTVNDTDNDDGKSKLAQTNAKPVKDETKSVNLPPRLRNKSIMNWKRQMRQRSKIGSVIEKLIARVSDQPMNVNATQTGLGLHFSAAAASGATSATSRSTDLFSPHQHLSPRKRMLKDFTEKVSLEDRGSTSTQKRLRSKSNASAIGDFASSGNTKSPGTNYSIVVTQHTANIACNDKDPLPHRVDRVANGSPPRSNSNAVEKSSRSSSSSAAAAVPSSSSSSSSSFLSAAKSGSSSHSHASMNEVTSTQPPSKPISNYSIKSLLGHNHSSSSSSTNNNHGNDSRTELIPNHDESRRSPRSPMSYASSNHHYPPHHPHQIIHTSSTSANNNSRSTSITSSSTSSPYIPKKKSPTNALINSPTHYRNARSPDINSPSPGPMQSNNSRYHSSAALSSPTPSGFHPYLSSSRGSPLSSSGTLSPTDLYRHRSYRMAAASPSNSSSGLSHPYASLNGSPTAFSNANAANASNRYSPMSTSTHSGSTKTSPNSDRSSVPMTQTHPHTGLSTVYNVSNLIPQGYDLNATMSELHRQQQLSPPNLKQHQQQQHRVTNDWSPTVSRPPPSNSSGHGSPTNYTTNNSSSNNNNNNHHHHHSNSSNSTSTTATPTTIPKKTALFRQKYGSLSPNGYAYGANSGENNNASSSSSSSTSSSTKAAGNDHKKPLSNSDSLANKRPKSPIDPQRIQRPTQQDYEKEMQARYNAEVVAMHHHQSLIASALQQQAAAAAAANPFYMAAASMHGGGGAPPNLPPSMAAYLNPLYYHPSASEMFRKTAHPSAAQMDLLHKNLVHSQWMDPYSAASLMQHYPTLAADKATLMAKGHHEIGPPPPGPVPPSLLASSPLYGLSSRSMPGSRDHQVGANSAAVSTDIEMWNAADAKKSPITSPTSSATPSAFRRHPQQFSDCKPISLIKDEPSSASG